MDRGGRSIEKKRKWMYSLARKKAEKESRLYFETVCFVCHYYCTENQEERKNYGSCLVRDDDGDIIFSNNNNNGIGNGRRKKKTRKKKPKAPKLTQLQLQQQKDDQKIEQEADHYQQTILFLRSFAHNKDATPQERITLHTACRNVVRVFTDFCFIYTTEDDDSWCHRNISLFINQHRSKVEEQLNYVCNNVSNLTIKQAFLPLLADFQTGTTPKDPPSQIHHPHLQDKDGNLMSSEPNMSSGEGSCSKPLPICDDELYSRYHEKCCCTPIGAEPKPIYEVEWEQEDAECPPDLTFADVESEEEW
nr:hypothetical protein [Tanacetum cinerariifolium]